MAFTLPIVERLQDDFRPLVGRSPRCLVLEPTRELAQQISNDFLSIKNRWLRVTTLYGGKRYLEQETSLKKGSDIVVGTPGRVKDFLQTKKLNLRQCPLIVLDEVDRMLDMGFQVTEIVSEMFESLFLSKEDVDLIIRNVSNGEKKSQLIVFSATIPDWLKKSVSKYMSKDNFSFHNLIGESGEKTAVNVQHFAVRCPSKENGRKDRLILDLFEKHSRDLNSSQMIIFCQTKSECDQLAQSNQIHSYPTAVLHGNLSQRKREEVIHKFRQGTIRFLITTDISARGLDIPQVDLVVLTSPPPVTILLSLLLLLKREI